MCTVGVPPGTGLGNTALSYAFTAQLHQSDKHITHLQEELIHQLIAPNEREQETMEQVKKLPAALAAAQCDQQQANAAQKDLLNRLQYAEQLLEKAKKDIKDKNAEISALEDRLERYSTEIENLTQHLDDANDELCISHIQELASNERSEGPQLKTSPAFAAELFPVTERRDPIQADFQAAHGMTIKDLNKLSNNISKATTSRLTCKMSKFHLEMRPHVTDRDRLCLLRATSSPEVRNFLDRQPSHTKSNYQLLCEVLIKDFTHPESEYGLLTALEIKQGRQETPQAYYNRLRQAYFGAHNKPDVEEDVNFKSLFIRNLHPGVSRHLGVMACPRSMTIQQLRDLTQKAYNKQKMASKKGNKTSTLLNSVTKDSSFALEDTQWHHDTRVLHQEHRERDPHFHTSYQPSHCEKPWDKPRFSEIPKERINRKPNWTCKANRPARPTRVGKQRQNPPTTQTSTVLSIHKKNTTYHQKTWN
ncbi:hypothetical protein M9458_032073, partial [Cirrhinus mrigala]